MSSKNSFSKHIFSCPHILSKPSDQHQRVVIEPCHFRLYVTWFNLSPLVPTRWLRVGHPVESTCCHSCKYNVHWVQVRARHICILLWSEQSWPLVNISPTNPRDLRLQLQCSYSSQRRGELDDNSDSQLVGWPYHLSHAFLGDTSYAWEPYISGQYVSTMVYSFNALGCQLICNVGRQLESVLNIFTFLSTAINLRLPDLVNQPRYAKSAW